MSALPFHTLRHGKDRFGWTEAQTMERVNYAHRLRHAARCVPGFINSLLRRHNRAQTWATVDGAVFLFAGSVCVAIYREDK